MIVILIFLATIIPKTLSIPPKTFISNLFLPILPVFFIFFSKTIDKPIDVRYNSRPQIVIWKRFELFTSR